jgi:hypothetical protein
MSNVLVILTCTVYINPNKHYLYQTNSNDRLECYLKSIKQWLEKTNLKICVVENSGYTFPELSEYVTNYNDRFEIITFNEFTLPNELQHLVYNTSKGASEMYSIIYAFNNTKFKKNINFIVKITGRYFIPVFQQFLTDIDIVNRSKHIGILDNKNMIIGLRQFDNNRCEIIGIHSIFFKTMFLLNLSDDNGVFYPHVETIYHNRYNLLNPDNIINCPRFEIEETQMGGNKAIVTDL